MSSQATYLSIPNNTASAWWRDRGLSKLVFYMAVLTISAIGSGVDSSLINGLQTIPAFNEFLGGLSANQLGLVIASFALGALPALPVSAYTMDWYGRKFPLNLGCISVIAGGIGQTFTKNPWTYFGTRFIIGFGIALTCTAAPTLVMEIAHPRLRGQASLLYNCSWYIGATLIGWTTYGTLTRMKGEWSWRLPSLVQVTPEMFLLVISLTLIPESPRWLISKGRKEEAVKILATYHANGARDDPLVIFETAEIEEALQQERQASSSSSWGLFFKTKGNRHRLLICVLVGFTCQWCGNGIVTYYLAPILKAAGVTDRPTQALINVCINIWNYPCAVAGAMLANRLGRRKLFFISTGGMLMSYIIITILASQYAKTGIHSVGYGEVAFLFIFFGFYDFGFTGLQVSYPIEVLTYQLRAKGYCITKFCNYLAEFFNQFVNPIGLKQLKWKYFIVYDCILAAMLVSQYFLFPETKGRTLEEIQEIFDGEALHAAEMVREGADVKAMADHEEHEMRV